MNKSNRAIINMLFDQIESIESYKAKDEAEQAEKNTSVSKCLKTVNKIIKTELKKNKLEFQILKNEHELKLINKNYETK